MNMPIFVNIVILHCHFERGGVTQVVENHVRALRESDQVERIVLVSGERANGLSEATLGAVTQVAIPAFDYDAEVVDPDALPVRRRHLVEQLEAHLADLGIDRDNSVLHWHNHSLGKNTAAPAAIWDLTNSGWRLLLQIHDFAEDNRPTNYRGLIEAIGATSKTAIDRYLYPVSPSVHYATLTRADASALGQLGVASSRVHCLPNSVVPPSGVESSKEESLIKLRRALDLPTDARWCLYPVRGIRRKNVGELLLLSRWLSPNQFAGLTLCPTTPVEQRSYRRWQQFARVVAPRLIFDAGHDSSVSFLENMSAADFIVSTSVAEGFGMAFLEPWLLHREVIARRLRTVTDDFESSGVRLDKFYDAIPIPGDATWLSDCSREITDANENAWSGLPKNLRPDHPEANDLQSDTIDFARLLPRRQVEVLQRAATDSGFESAMMERSSVLLDHLRGEHDDVSVEANANVVRREYSPQRTGERLKDLYDRLLAAPSSEPVAAPPHAGIGIDVIAGARPFYPCRTEVLDD